MKWIEIKVPKELGETTRSWGKTWRGYSFVIAYVDELGYSFSVKALNMQKADYLHKMKEFYETFAECEAAVKAFKKALKHPN